VFQENEMDSSDSLPPPLEREPFMWARLISICTADQCRVMLAYPELTPAWRRYFEERLRQLQAEAGRE
jgi:hypothetical protein